MTAPLPVRARGDVVLDAGDVFGSVTATDPDAARRAALTVCDRARDVADARELLTMLGLIGARR